MGLTNFLKDKIEGNNKPRYVQRIAPSKATQALNSITKGAKALKQEAPRRLGNAGKKLDSAAVKIGDFGNGWNEKIMSPEFGFVPPAVHEADEDNTPNFELSSHWNMGTPAGRNGLPPIFDNPQMGSYPRGNRHRHRHRGHHGKKPRSVTVNF